MAHINLILSEQSPEEIRVSVLGDALPSGPLSERISVDRAEVESLGRRISKDLLDWANRPQDLRAGPSTREALERTGLALFQVLFGRTGDALRSLKRDWNATERYCLLHLDEELVHLPIELCFDGDAFFCETFLIGRHVSTAGTNGRIQAREMSPPRLLCLVNPSEDPFLADSAEEELREIRKVLPTSKTIDIRPHLGRTVDATLLDRELPGATIVHLIGHADYDADRPAESGWRLFGRRWYGPDRVSRLQNPPRIVFANGCATARPEGWRTHLTLVRAFLERGTSAYIGTWWDIRSASAAGFARTFYRTIAEGSTVGAALARAQREVAERSESEDLTWASYVLYGDPRTPFPLPSSAGLPVHTIRRAVILGVVLVALGILLPSTLGQRESIPGRVIEETVSRGYLTLESEPPGARVIVDGRARGSTPITLELAEGEHEIVVEHSHYARWEASAVVDPKNPQVIRVRLEEESP